MHAHSSYKPMQKINLKRKRDSKDEESGAGGALGSYKSMKITNQLDDDVQFVEAS